jgi:ATP-dependent RNA helicase SUPV3L1/SUV3
LLSALGIDRRPLQESMLPVVTGAKRLPSGYRPAGSQAIRIDLAEKILRSAHETRAKVQAKDRRRKFVLDTALAISIGLEDANIARLLGQAGFRVQKARALAAEQFGPPQPDRWEWRPTRRKQDPTAPARPREGSAFAVLADLVR